MELLVQGAMVERFERKKVDVKHRLNDMVDDLFAFMLSEVSALLTPPRVSTLTPNVSHFAQLCAAPSTSSLTSLPSIASGAETTTTTTSTTTTSAATTLFSQQHEQNQQQQSNQSHQRTTLILNTPQQKSQLVEAQQSQTSSSPLFIKEVITVGEQQQFPHKKFSDNSDYENDDDDDEDDDEYDDEFYEDGFYDDDNSSNNLMIVEDNDEINHFNEKEEEEFYENEIDEDEDEDEVDLNLISSNNNTLNDPSVIVLPSELSIAQVSPIRPSHSSNLSSSITSSHPSTANSGKRRLPSSINLKSKRHLTNGSTATTAIINSSSYHCCDSDSELCRCYECMDESLVEVEINDEPENFRAEQSSSVSVTETDTLQPRPMLVQMMPVVRSSKCSSNFKRQKQKSSNEAAAAIKGIVPTTDVHRKTSPKSAAKLRFCLETVEKFEELDEDSKDDDIELDRKKRDAASSSGDGSDSGSGIKTNGENESGEGENVPSNHQILTLGLKCYIDGCEAMLDDRAKLNQHLFFDHDHTLPYRCRVAGCSRAFEIRKEFWTHIRNGHTDYTCELCGVKFNGYFPFITHEFQLHEEGVFKCSREDCDFVATLRDHVYKHTKMAHVKFSCTYDGCGQSFECYSYLKRHRRIHSQVKPYRCKWPNCGYSSTQCGAVIQHIRIRHFKLPSSMKKQRELNIVDHRNPNDFLEVLTELLN